MSKTAIQVVTAAYLRYNLEAPTSFSTSQEYPYNISLDVLNNTLGEMNRVGNLEFTETKTALPYSGGAYTYDMSTLLVDQRRIHFLRREASGYCGELIAYPYRKFLSIFRGSAVQTTQPTAWAKFGDTLELSSIPDQDYEIYIYHWKDMPQVTDTTDTFLIPENDEDVLIENTYSYLKYVMGGWSYAEAVAAIRAKTTPFIVVTKNDSAIPTQMPAMF